MVCFHANSYHLVLDCFKFAFYVCRICMKGWISFIKNSTLELIKFLHKCGFMLNKATLYHFSEIELFSWSYNLMQYLPLAVGL